MRFSPDKCPYPASLCNECQDGLRCDPVDPNKYSATPARPARKERGARAPKGMSPAVARSLGLI
jgi:hypothetical protein